MYSANLRAEQLKRYTLFDILENGSYKARKEVAETAPCQYSVEELEHRLGESVQSYRKGDCCTSDELRKRHPICE